MTTTQDSLFMLINLNPVNAEVYFNKEFTHQALVSHRGI